MVALNPSGKEESSLFTGKTIKIITLETDPEHGALSMIMRRKRMISYQFYLIALE